MWFVSLHPDITITDPEAMTIYLYAMHVEQQFKIKQIDGYTEHSLATKFIMTPVTLTIQKLRAYIFLIFNA